MLLFLCCCTTTSVPNGKQQTTEKAVQLNPIQQLKQGFLLVRLRSIEKQMEVLRYNRKRTEAYRLRNKTKAQNAYIIKAFSENFTFAPVYFFYSKHSRRIRANQLDSIILDNELLPVDNSIIENRPFLVAEFSEIQPPADGAGLSALIVMDNQLHQLKKPFPYYVRTSILGEEGMEQAAVKLLEERLKTYASKQ